VKNDKALTPSIVAPTDVTNRVRNGQQVRTQAIERKPLLSGIKRKSTSKKSSGAEQTVSDFVSASSKVIRLTVTGFPTDTGERETMIESLRQLSGKLRCGRTVEPESNAEMADCVVVHSASDKYVTFSILNFNIFTMFVDEV
jgi:hypothetical protein